MQLSMCFAHFCMHDSGIGTCIVKNSAAAIRPRVLTSIIHLDCPSSRILSCRRYGLLQDPHMQHEFKQLNWW